MPAPDPSLERRALSVSIGATAILGVLGVVWGLATGSQMILLDGVYAGIGMAVSWLLLRASALAAEGPSHHYPYGKEAATPLVIGIQGFILLATLVYAGIGAVRTILAGGSQVAAGRAIAYGVLVTGASIIVWLWLHRSAESSDLVFAEATAWRVAAYRGVGMVAGFTILALLIGSAWESIAPFVDPAMVLLTCLLFIGAPLRMVRSTFVELLEGAPRESLTRPVSEAVQAVTEQYGLAEPTVRMSKVGPKLYLEVEGTAPPEVTIAHAHVVREDLRRRLNALPVDVWLNFELLPDGGRDAR